MLRLADARRWLIRAAAIAAGLSLLLMLVVLLFHTAPVRDAVLRRTAAFLADRFNLRLQAESLSYNLITRRVSLSGVSLAASHSLESPFLTADRIDVSFPSSVLLGRLAVDRIRLDNVHVALVSAADGSTNLPAAEPSSGPGSPANLSVGRIEIPRLAITVDDERSHLALSLPNLSVDVGPESGRVQLIEMGRAALRDRTTAVTGLGGGLTFDGRALHFANFVLTTDEADVTVDGAVALLVGEPGIELWFSGTVDVAGVARWATTQPVPAGTLAISGTIDGPFTAPLLAAHLRSQRLTYERVTATGLDLDLRVNRQRVQAPRIEAVFADGRVTGAAALTFATGDASVTASWSALDVERLARMISPLPSPMPAGRASGKASFAGAMSDVASWTLDVSTRIAAAGPSDGRLPVAGDAALRVEHRMWRLTGRHSVAGTSLRTDVRGGVDADALALSSIAGSVEMDTPDLAILMSSLRTARIVNDSTPAITAGQLEARASLSGSIARPRLELTATGRELSVLEVSGVRFEAKADGTRQRAAVEARVEQGSANTLNITGTVWPDDARLDAEVSGILTDMSALVPGLPIAGAVDLRLDVRGPFRAIAARGSASIRDARYEDAALGDLDAQLSVDADVARVDISAPDFGATAHADVRIQGVRTGSIDLQVQDADVGRLLRAANLDAAIGGTLSLTAHAEGPLDDWRQGAAAIDISAFEGRADALPVRLQEPARVGYERGTLDVMSLEAALGETRLSIGGRYAVLDDGAPIGAGDALRGVLVGDLAQVLDAARASGLVDETGVAGRGPVALLARANGRGSRPLVSVDLDIGSAEITAGELPSARGIQVRARIVDGWAELVSASGTWQDAAVAAQGRVPLSFLSASIPEGLLDSPVAVSGPASLDLRATSIGARVLAPVLPPESIAQIDGSLDATMHLEATSLELESVHGEARLDRLELQIAGLPVRQREPTRIEIEKGIATLASWNWTGQGATLVVQGQVRLANREAAILAGGQIDLRLLTPFLPGAHVALAGSVAPRVSVSGPLDDLLIEGDVIVAGGELRLRDPDVIVTGVSATATLSPARARITSFEGQINGGALTGTGDVTYDGAAGLAGRLGVTIAGMGLEFPEGLRSELDANLSLDVSRTGDDLGGTLSGTATVVRSAYREPIAVVTRVLGALRTERLAAAATATTEESFADRLRLNVRVVTDSDVVVDNNLARLQLGGDLRVIGTAAAPALSGRATLREGGELFIGRNRYTIESGSIDFTNPLIIEPDLNIQAQTRAGGEDIELTLKGTPETVSVDLRSTSDPQLGQADIASLLITGRPLNQVSGAEGQIVGEQVVAYLSGDVLGAASRVVGLDTIRLGGVDQATLRRDSAEIASETDPTSRLTFGKSLGSFLEVTLSQSLRDGGAQTWILDYTPVRRVDLRFVSSDDNLRSYEFQHDVTVGGTERRRPARKRSRESLRVTAVLFTGDLGGPEDRLRRVMKLEPGELFDFTDWQRDRDRLERTLHDEGHLEARVSARRRDGPGGVELVYDLDAGPLTAIRVTGATLSQDTMRAVETAWTRTIFDAALSSETERLVRLSLAEQGYLQPAVAVTVTTNGTKTLDIVIDPGARSVDRRIVFETGDDELARALERWVRASGMEQRAWRDPGEFERSLVAELRTRGHVNPQVSVSAPQTNGSVALVRVQVIAGSRVTVGGVQISGGGDVESDRLAKAAGLESGAPYDPSRIDQARERIARVLRGEGYAEARVEAQAEAAPDGQRVTVRFKVERGPRQVLREIAVSGNRVIDRDVITRALDINVGDPLGADAWLKARSRLFDTALFRRVDVSAEPVADAPPAERPMRLQVTVEEWPALRVRYGLQLSEERPEGEVEGRDLTPGLSAAVTRRTLFGRAITVAGAFEYQRHERLARGLVTVPTLWGLPVESLTTVERSREEIADASVVTDRNGVSWEQRVRVATSLRLSYGYRFDRDRTFSTRPSDDPFNPPFDITVNVARLTSSAVFDTRNDPLETSRGHLISSNFEYAPESLGSDIRFVRYLAQAYRFQPLGRVVFASAARVGLATPLGGQVLIPSERFFAGGARTVRGVAEDGLGPRDIFGDAAGGGALMILNQEVRFPIYRWFRGVGFIDAGNVFERPRAVDFRDLVGSVGAGLRVTTPFALLRADVAKLWSPEAGQPTARWTFGIGHTF